MSKVYGYGRHSTDKQGATEAVQKDRCMAWHLENLPHLDWCGWHYDDDVSAKNRWSERPRGRELDMLLTRDDWLITADSSRMFRRNSDTFTTIEKFSERGIHLRMLDLIATANLRPAEKGLIEGQVLLVKQYERDTTRQRELDRIAYCKKHGLPYARNESAPVGWRVVRLPSGGREFRVNQFERTVCDMMATLQAEGMSQEQIASWSNRQARTEWSGKKMRQFSTKAIVRWGLRARMADYPLVGSRDEFTRRWAAGEWATVET